MPSGEAIALIILELISLARRLLTAADAEGMITPEQKLATERRIQAAVAAWSAAADGDRQET